MKYLIILISLLFISCIDEPKKKPFKKDVIIQEKVKEVSYNIYNNIKLGITNIKEITDKYGKPNEIIKSKSIFTEKSYPQYFNYNDKGILIEFKPARKNSYVKEIIFLENFSSVLNIGLRIGLNKKECLKIMQLNDFDEKKSFMNKYTFKNEKDKGFTYYLVFDDFDNLKYISSKIKFIK